jgi:hypothetical protein
MLLNLTREQIEEIIKALEKEPNQIADKYSVLNYPGLTQLSHAIASWKKAAKCVVQGVVGLTQQGVNLTYLVKTPQSCCGVCLRKKGQ